jgi:hypothetical protein
MKKLLLMIAAVGMLFTACNKECGHDFIEHDFSQELVGTWTCLDEDFAEAMVIKADGSVEVTGVVDGEYYESKGTIQVKNNKMIYKLDNGDEWEGRFEMIPGQSFAMVFVEDLDIRYTYHYCENDLSDEVIGMWVSSNDVTGMAIQTYQEDGTCIYTGFSVGANDYLVNKESTYNVVGDMMFQKAGSMHFVTRLTYLPNGNTLGDILNTTATILVNDEYVTSSYSFLRIKQSLDLTGKTYDYSSAYVSNAKGKDEDFSMLGHTFNMADIKGGNFDMLFRSELFCVDLNTNSITQRFRANGRDIEIVIPITVDGNKVTLDLSAENPAYRKVDMYMFQDADNSQLHMYMPTDSFINYFANMELYNLLASGEITADNTTAIEKVYTDMEARIESINVSFVFKARN